MLNALLLFRSTGSSLLHGNHNRNVTPGCHTNITGYKVRVYYELVWFWFGFIEDLRRFSGISAISRLGSGR